MTALIKGVDRLKGTTVEGKDLRGGAALILAGLAAEGETVVTNANFVERGYERIESVLGALGADIRLLPEAADAQPNAAYIQDIGGYPPPNPRQAPGA